MDVKDSGILQKSGVIGPLFISIGDPEGEKLSLFLEKNPRVPRDLILTDDYSFSAYDTVGLKKIGEDTNAMKNAKMIKPEGINWLSYISSVGKLAPIPKGLKFGEVPQGVLYLGGTLGLQGEKVIYSFADGVPGAHPEPAEVVKAFGIKV